MPLGTAAYNPVSGHHHGGCHASTDQRSHSEEHQQHSSAWQCGRDSGSTIFQGPKQARISDTIDSYTGTAVFSPVSSAALMPADENAALPPNTQFTFTRPVSCGVGDTSTSSVISTVRLLDTSSAPIASAAAKTGVSGSVTCNRPQASVFSVQQAPVTSVQQGHYDWSIGAITAAPVTIDQPSGALTYTGQVTVRWRAASVHG